MITYKSNNNNVYFYILDDFKIDFNLNFNFKDFLYLSKDNQKNFFYSNMEFALKKHIKNCIIKIENYANNEDYKPLIIFLHSLTINRIKLKKHMRIGKFIELEIPIMNNLDSEKINLFYENELFLLKKLEKEQESKNENTN